MLPPKKCTAKLADKIILNEKFVQLKFEWVEPHLVQFQAGQYISILIGNGPDRRSYSICSAPENEHGFDLLLDITPNGIGVKYLNGLQFGQEISCLCALGMLTVPPTAAGKPLHFIATGSGIAPFHGMILDQLQTQKNTQPIHLYWGMREINNLFWIDEFAELMESFPNFQFHPVISQPVEAWPLCRGHVTDCLTVHPLMPEALYYICGKEQMILEVIQTLTNLGVNDLQIHRESFYQ